MMCGDDALDLVADIGNCAQQYCFSDAGSNVKIYQVLIYQVLSSLRSRSGLHKNHSTRKYFVSLMCLA